MEKSAAEALTCKLFCSGQLLENQFSPGTSIASGSVEINLVRAAVDRAKKQRINLLQAAVARAQKRRINLLRTAADRAEKQRINLV